MESNFFYYFSWKPNLAKSKDLLWSIAGEYKLYGFSSFYRTHFADVFKCNNGATQSDYATAQAYQKPSD